MDLVGNNVDTLHEEREYLVGHLVGNVMWTPCMKREFI
jgi:hypothetical protein